MQLTLAYHAAEDESSAAVHRIGGKITITVRARRKPDGALGECVEHEFTLTEFEDWLRELTGNFIRNRRLHP